MFLNTSNVSIVGRVNNSVKLTLLVAYHQFTAKLQEQAQPPPSDETTEQYIVIAMVVVVDCIVRQL